MTDLRRNILIYLAGLFTISEMMLADVLDGRSYAPIRYLTPIFGLIGLCFAFLPMFTLHRHGRVEPGKNYMQATTLVDRGLYSVVRHPQYLGYMCFNVTFMLISQHCLIILLGSLAVTLFYLYALREEKHLIEKFGREYKEYIRQVPRLNILLGLTRAVRRWIRP